MTSRSSRALAGIAAAAATLGVAELAALVVAPASSPLLAVGSWVIDIVPPWVKDAAIALFGTADKIALLVCLGILVLGLAVVVGLLPRRWGFVGLGAVGAVALFAVLTRAGATPLWAVPTVVGLVVGGAVLWRPRVRAAGPMSRRGFLVVAGAAVLVGVGARLVNASLAAVNSVRSAIQLPTPESSAAAPPPNLAIEGITPLVTSNADFYRVDTALQIPAIDASTWRLRITGMVEREVELSYAELLALPLVESYVTLACVSNDIGGPLVGNAKWLGYPLAPLLARAGVLDDADMVLSRSADGWTAGTPLSALTDPGRLAILAVGMNDEPLPLEHGFPVRMVVAGLFGYVSATKWLTELRVSRFADESAYWTDRGWAEQAPVKMSSRIDVPAYTAVFDAGTVPIAGVAWAQHIGVARVEVRIDRGSWRSTTLAPAISDDTWVQWSTSWQATPGVHIIEVRATDKRGFMQSSARVDTVPDGAEGLFGITVDVR